MEAGMPASAVRALLVDNPARALTIVPSGGLRSAGGEREDARTRTGKG